MAYTKAHQRANDRYDKTHATRISLKLMNSTDADILSALENAPSKQGEIKRLLRVALAEEKKTENNK